MRSLFTLLPSADIDGSEGRPFRRFGPSLLDATCNQRTLRRNSFLASIIFNKLLGFCIGAGKPRALCDWTNLPHPRRSVMLKSLYLAGLTVLAVSLLAVLTSAQAPTNSSTVQSSVPRLIRFSGSLKDANNNGVSGRVNLTFSIYKDQSGGTSLWSESQNVEADAQGRYSVMLGATSSAGLSVEFFSSGEALLQVVKQLEEGVH